MQAAFLRIFLRHIDDWNAKRREAAARYGELLAGVVDTPPDEDGHVYHMYCVRSPERDRLAAALDEADISYAVYYQPPLHLQPALRYLGYSEGDFPETERRARTSACRSGRESARNNRWRWRPFSSAPPSSCGRRCASP
jgi:dTDP-4-amino-4,6-dideoxygalactose transaminase